MAFLFLLIATVFTGKNQASTMFEDLVNGSYSSFTQKAQQEIRQSKTRSQKRIILRLVRHHFSLFYTTENFTGKIIPYHNGKCLKSNFKDHECFQENGYSYRLEQTNDQQSFSMTYQGKEILRYNAVKRSALKEVKSIFGLALHHIKKNTAQDRFFILLRETEKDDGNNIYLHTINLFRIEKAQACKLAEINVTHKSDQYELIVEYAKALSSFHDCSLGPIYF